MAAKTKFFKILEDSVNASSVDIWESPVPPTGKVVRLNMFGGFDPGIGDNIASTVAIQWGAPGPGWNTIRVGGDGGFEFIINENFTGDNVKRFRVVRMNDSASNKKIYAWMRAIVNDQ